MKENILQAQHDRIRTRELLGQLDTATAESRTAILSLIGSIADGEMVPELIRCLESHSWVVRAKVARILGRFAQAEVRDGPALSTKMRRDRRCR